MAGLQATLARFGLRWQRDVRHRVAHVYTPFLAGHFEQMREDHELAFDGGGGDFLKAFIPVTGEIDPARTCADSVSQWMSDEGANTRRFRGSSFF